MTIQTSNGLIKLAKQAGFDLEFDDYVYEHWDNFQAFAKLVASEAIAKEREACAKVIENDCIDDMTREEEAAAIRARGTHE